MNITWEYLTTPIIRPDVIWPYFAVILILVVASIVCFVTADKKKIPKFQKRFIRKVGDFLLYIPILFSVVVLAVYAMVNSINLPIYIAILGLIWLIWLVFLIYYRIVVISEFWKLYYKQKKEEKYIHGEGKDRR